MKVELCEKWNGVDINTPYNKIQKRGLFPLPLVNVDETSLQLDGGIQQKC